MHCSLAYIAKESRDYLAGMLGQSQSVCHAKQSTRIDGARGLSLAAPADGTVAVIERLPNVVSNSAPKKLHS